MERVCQIEEELLIVFDNVHVVHEILAFEVDLKLYFTDIEQKFLNCQFCTPLPGLEVFPQNEENLKQISIKYQNILYILTIKAV